MILIDTHSGEEVEPVVIDDKAGRPLGQRCLFLHPGPHSNEAMRSRYLECDRLREALSAQPDICALPRTPKATAPHGSHS
ncbi:hypothetical protein ACWER6_30140 [Streptomyces sp. NPDC004009]